MKNHSRKWQYETHIDDDRPLTVGIPVKQFKEILQAVGNLKLLKFNVEFSLTKKNVFCILWWISSKSDGKSHCFAFQTKFSTEKLQSTPA